MQNFYLPVIFFQLVIITYLSFIIVDVRWEIRSGFKTQERLTIQNEELEKSCHPLATATWGCLIKPILRLKEPQVKRTFSKKFFWPVGNLKVLLTRWRLIWSLCNTLRDECRRRIISFDCTTGTDLLKTIIFFWMHKRRLMHNIAFNAENSV